jgi:hypothetical protein
VGGPGHRGRADAGAGRGELGGLAGGHLGDLAFQVEHRLDVHDRGPVEGLQVAHEHAEAVDGGDADPVQPDRVRPVLRAGAEHASLGVPRVVARVHREHVAPRPVQPGQHEDLGAGGEVADAFGHAGVEHQPRLRRSFEPLLGRGLAVDEGRLDVPDRPHLVEMGCSSPLAVTPAGSRRSVV